LLLISFLQNGAEVQPPSLQHVVEGGDSGDIPGNTYGIFTSFLEMPRNSFPLVQMTLRRGKGARTWFGAPCFPVLETPQRRGASTW